MYTERTDAGRGVPEPLRRSGAEDYAAWFRALGDPTRVQIVSVLARGGRALTVGEIVAAVKVSQSTVSQHLRVLAEVGFVVSERRGAARYYRIDRACAGAFPTAGDLVAGRTPPSPGAAAARPAAAPGAPGSAAGGVTTRPMRPADAADVLAIYQAGLDTGQASFETEAPSWQAFDAAKLPGHRHVAVSPGRQVLGWAAVSPVSGRCVYAGVVEHSVYVAPGARGQGTGTALLGALIESTEAAGIWTIQSGIFPENTASLRLHERAGFRVVGIRRRLGRHYGRWRDVMLVERRSPVTGTG